MPIDDWNISIGKIRQQAEAWRQMKPYLERLHKVGQRLGWLAGDKVFERAVRELEQLVILKTTPPPEEG
jgi:hypothetical protein